MLTWAERLGEDGNPYLVRWVLRLGRWSIRLHRWQASDDLRAPHDHEWDFWSVLLAGFAWDRRPGTTGGYVAGDPASWNDTARRWLVPEFFPAEHRHSLVVGPRGAWTLLLTAPRRREWGFWLPRRGGPLAGVVRFVRRNKYFRAHGHHGTA